MWIVGSYLGCSCIGRTLSGRFGRVRVVLDLSDLDAGLAVVCNQRAEESRGQSVAESVS